ncbi:MAG: hypothetical protein U0792_11230 [Gemmataceae bacterium]
MFSRKSFLPGMESLGERSLPSATLTNHVLEVVGTGSNDFIRVAFAAPNQLRVTIPSTGEDVLFDRGQVTTIRVRALGGDDTVVIGPNLQIQAEVRAWTGNDTVLGGGADDTLVGGSGDDNMNGRGGNDTIHGGEDNDSLTGGSGNNDLFGEAGDDRLNGGLGDDSIDGGSGRDIAKGGGGTDDIGNSTNLDTELTAVFTGGGGANFKFGPDNGGIEREFEVEVEDLTPNGTAGIFVDGQSVGSISLDALGAGQFKLETDFDTDHDGVASFPAGFPEISVGSIVTIQQNGNVVRQGTFA